jgi:hypothetical protein
MTLRGEADRGCGGDVLEERIGRALADTDPVPPALQPAAYELFTWRTVDAELAELLRAPAPAD